MKTERPNINLYFFSDIPTTPNDGGITGEWLDTYRMEEAKPDVTFERITPKDSLESRGYRNVTWYYSREFENEFKPERYKGHFYISEAGILFDLTTR